MPIFVTAINIFLNLALQIGQYLVSGATVAYSICICPVVDLNPHSICLSQGREIVDVFESTEEDPENRYKFKQRPVGLLENRGDVAEGFLVIIQAVEF